MKDGLRGGRPFNPHSFVFFLFFLAQCLLRAKKMPGLLIISILNGLFKTGHVKVRDSEINHADSSFPPVELVAALVDHCRSAQFRRLASNKCMDAAALDLAA